MIRVAPPSAPLPDSWLHELGEAPPGAGARTLALSVYDEVKLPPGVTFERLARDLSQGARIRHMPDRVDRYLVWGSELRLFVSPRAGRDTGRTLAVLGWVERRVDLGTTDPGPPLSVTFEDIREEVASDLAALLRDEEAWLAAQARGAARLAVPEGLAERLRAHTRPHRMLLALQRVRFDLAPRTPIEATVVTDPSAGPGLLAVELAPGRLRDGDRAKLAGDGEDARCRVAWTEEDRAHLRMPPGPVPPSGERIALILEERFPLEAQKKALRRLVDLDLVGNPDRLGALLLDPASLPPPASDSLPVYFHNEGGSTPLDAAQRRAVARAVTAPSAAFVHGPPGTGKSTVIVEVIRHLVARGERVLFTSPSHVAVDEVVRRLRGVPGVRPLRLSWAEGLVHEEVRAFTPGALTRDAAKAVLAGNSRIAADRRALLTRRQVLTRTKAARTALSGLQSEVRSAREERETAVRAYVERQRAWLARTGSQADLDAARRALDRTIAAEGAVARRLAALGSVDATLDEESGGGARAAGDARLARLDGLAALEAEWREARAALGAKAEQTLVAELDELPLRAANVVACTITGLAGSPHARDAEFDTLIVDEASRVTEGQFLLGAVRARRWVLVGDEHQLPPHVDPADEQTLHALVALRAVREKRAASIAEAVKMLSELWEEEEELRVYREDAVRAEAEGIEARGEWERYAEVLTRHELDDRALLRTLRDLLVRSFFERAVASLRGPAQACATRLEVQRRMVPALASLVAGPIYDGAYLSPSEGVLPTPLPVLRTPLLWLDTSKDGPRALEVREGNGFVNPAECARIIELLRRLDTALAAAGHTPVPTSILCFYRAQARLVSRRLAERRLACLNIELVDAIDKIQGQQSDLVVVSFCRARLGRRGEGFGAWLRDYRRLNVACTRARRNLVLVGHGDTLKRFSGPDDRAGRFYANLFACAERAEPWIRTELDSRADPERK